MNDVASAALSLPPSTLPILAGYSAFASSLALSTLLQLKLLGVSTGSPRPIPSLIGMASVALSSLASHNACIKAHGFLGRHRGAETRQTTPIIGRFLDRIIQYKKDNHGKLKIHLSLVLYKLKNKRYEYVSWECSHSNSWVVASGQWHPLPTLI